MKTLTAEEFKKKYGIQGVEAFSQSSPASPKQGYGQQVGEAFKSGINYAAEGVQEAAPVGGGGASGLIGGVSKIIGGTAQALLSPIAPPLDDTLGKGINYAGEKLADAGGEGYQKFAMSDTGQKTANVAEGVANYATGAGLVAGGVSTPKISKALTSRATSPPKVSPPSSGVGTYAKSTARDILPTKQSLINSTTAKSLEMTPGDLSTLKIKTGNELGPWLAENNLIGTNAKTTQGLIKNFFDESYKAVRTEIDKVSTVYKQYQVPRYVDALKEIQTQVKGTVGLEKETAIIDNLLNKQSITLKDVQLVKELMDEHFSLYKITGDVGEGVTKQGLAKVRDGLKSFIEGEVKKHTGADIGKLNNGVMTAKSVLDFIQKRESKGLTRSNLQPGDTTAFWSGMGAGFFVGGPLGALATGLAAVFFKKIVQSPTVMLRFARWLDNLSDAQKAKIKAEVEAGRVPPEFQPFMKQTTGPEGATRQPTPKVVPSSNPSTLMDKAKGVMNTVKTEGKKGFVANPFSKKVSNIHPDDLKVMEDFIDHARLKTTLGDGAFKEASLLAEKFGISMDLGLAKVANEFEKVLQGSRKTPNTVVKQKPSQVPYEKDGRNLMEFENADLSLPELKSKLQIAIEGHEEAWLINLIKKDIKERIR